MPVDSPDSLEEEVDRRDVRDQDVEVDVQRLLGDLGGHENPTFPASPVDTEPPQDRGLDPEPLLHRKARVEKRAVLGPRGNSLVDLLRTGNLVGEHEHASALPRKPARVHGDVDRIDTEGLERHFGRLPGGMAAIAAGLEYREETIADDPDPRVALTNPSRITVAGSGGTAVRGGRDLTSAYAELSLPLMKGLETQVAVRRPSCSSSE